MTHPRIVSIPCPFGEGAACKNTLIATVVLGMPGMYGLSPDDTYYPPTPTVVKDFRGCSNHKDMADSSFWLRMLFLDQLIQDDQDAKEQHDDQKIDEALGK